MAVVGLTCVANAQSQGTFPGGQPPAAPTPTTAPPPAPEEPAPVRPRPPEPRAPAAVTKSPPRENAVEARPTEPAPPPPPPPAVTPVVAVNRADLPYRLPYELGDPVPSGYRVEERSNTGLMWGGGLMLSAAYVAAIMAGPSGNEDGAGWVLVPVIGPFAAVMEQQVVCEASVLDTSTTAECSEEIITAARTATFLVVDGLVQTAGAALLLIGWGTTERHLVLDRQVAILPEARQGTYGVSVSGTF